MWFSRKHGLGSAYNNLKFGLSMKISTPFAVVGMLYALPISAIVGYARVISFLKNQITRGYPTMQLRRGDLKCVKT